MHHRIMHALVEAPVLTNGILNVSGGRSARRPTPTEALLAAAGGSRLRTASSNEDVVEEMLFPGPAPPGLLGLVFWKGHLQRCESFRVYACMPPCKLSTSAGMQPVDCMSLGA